MGETDSHHPATEQAAAHPGSSPRTLERYRVRGGEPACVSCCNRMRDLRCGLDGRIAEDEPIVVSSPRTIAFVTAGKSLAAKINFRRTPE